MAAPNLRQALIGASAAIALTATSALSQEAESSEETKLAQSFTTPAAATLQEVAVPAATGAPVVFEYGPGISEADIASVVRGVNERGCPASADNTGIPLTVTAKTKGETFMFDEPVDAAGWALNLCREPT